MFNKIYKDKTVLITGHTGFKGSWLALWLNKMGAKVVGYSLSPATEPCHYELLNIDYISIIGDIRDHSELKRVLGQVQPDIVFHLAAQPLVRRSYHDPIETFSTNLMGTANLLDVCRECSNLKAIIVVTSDKCYETKEMSRGYCETDRLGGHDPYSASKGCAELITSSYRRSFFSLEHFEKTHTTLISTARAGNVIGGGDWSEDRLIPDIARAVTTNKTFVIRNPDSVRPWQHVLECLSGYLLLGQKLLEGKVEFADAWNFGPADNDSLKVKEIVEELKKLWGNVNYELSCSEGPHETAVLNLDCSKSRLELGWKPTWDIDKTLEVVADWYLNFHESQKVISEQQLQSYIESAKNQNSIWAQV